MLHITSLHNIYLSETQPFRKVHRMIDLFETIIKTHTAVMMGEYFKHNQISDTAKGMLAAGLRTPSLGTWQLFSRELYKELKEANHVFLCNDFAKAFEALDKALNQEKTNVISFRNGYAHGATPTDEQCENDIKQFEPFLSILLSLQWLNESNIEAFDGKVHLKKEIDVLNLHPIIAYRIDEDEQPFVFFNDLKNDKVGLLNYPLSKHYRDKSFFTEFNQYLPLQDWKKTGSNIFNQRIEELTETFKGRLTERATIKKFVTAKQKGFLSIQGNPGIGKSALIAQVYKDLSNSEEKLPIQLVEYFIRRGTPQAEVSYLINYLIKKTDELFPAGKEIRAEGQTTWELQQQLHNKWNAFGESESPFKIIFLIDGLDEGVENDILKYLPRETFNNILFMYGSRPGGHQQLDKFWGELPIEHHQKIELGGLSKEDIRALLYEVANKYVIDKDSKWIDYLQKRSQGNPLYLKLLCNAIEEGSIAINDENALPEKIDDYYKAILQRYAQMPDGDHLLNSLFVFAAARDYLTPMHLSEILGFGPAKQTNVMSTLVEVLYENPMTENVLDYQLFHESLREYLKKDRATEVAKAEQKIIEFCGRWNTLEGNYEQQYILRHYAAHLSTQQNQAYHLTLIALTKDAEFIATQKKVLRNFEATHQLYQYGIETATKNNWNEAAIDCGLGIVDLKYEEQNDVTAILEMVKQNEMELALQRITALGGPSAEDKKRQFIVIMLCIMELTLLESKIQPWRKNAIEKLLGLMEEQIPIDHSLLNWDNFFSSYLIFLIACDWEDLGLDYSIIFNRTMKWDYDWIKEKGPYSDEQLNVLIRTAECINENFEISQILIEIALMLEKFGNLFEGIKLIKKSIKLAEGIYDESFKNYTFMNISVLLANYGEIDASIHTTDLINDYTLKCYAFMEIAVILMNHGRLEEGSILEEKSIVMAENINDIMEKFVAFKGIAVGLITQGKLVEADTLLEKLIKMAEEMNDNREKISAFEGILVVLRRQGKVVEADVLLEKLIKMAEDINDSWEKSFAFKDIAIELANRGEVEKLIKMAEDINDSWDSWEKYYVFKGIAIELANLGEVEKSIHMAERINDTNEKISAFKEIAIELANQGKSLVSYNLLEKSIQLTERLNSDWEKTIAFEEFALVLANQGRFLESCNFLMKSIQRTKGINDELVKSYALMEVSTVFANKKEIQNSIHIAEAISYEDVKSLVFRKIEEMLSNQAEIEKSIKTDEEKTDYLNKTSRFNEFELTNLEEIEESTLIADLVNFSKFSESIQIIGKIEQSSDRIDAWIDIGKEFYKNHQLQNINQTLPQLPNDEAITFFKKGIAQSITATNATEETILQILPLVKADKESTEHLMQMHALYFAFFEKTPKEKIQKFNRSLNIQWALDVIAKFPKEENVVRAYSNLEEWIEEVEDEDDKQHIEIWARQVIKGKITEGEFGEFVKGMG